MPARRRRVRTSSTFSCDIAYSDSPAALRAALHASVLGLRRRQEIDEYLPDQEQHCESAGNLEGVAHLPNASVFAPSATTPGSTPTLAVGLDLDADVRQRPIELLEIMPRSSPSESPPPSWQPRSPRNRGDPSASGSSAHRST